jgi:hypothetical protein
MVARKQVTTANTHCCKFPLLVGPPQAKCNNITVLLNRTATKSNLLRTLHPQKQLKVTILRHISYAFHHILSRLSRLWHNRKLLLTQQTCHDGHELYLREPHTQTYLRTIGPRIERALGRS